MSSIYNVPYSSTGITGGKDAIRIYPGDIDTSTSLVLPGQGKTDYGQFFDANILQILENFANPSSPSNPTTGQLWYNPDDFRLRYYIGTNTGIDNSDNNNPGWIIIQTIMGTIPHTPMCGETHYNTTTNELLVYNCTTQSWSSLASTSSSDTKYVFKAGDTMTSYLVLSGNAILDYHAVPKIQLDEIISGLNSSINTNIAGIIPTGTRMLFVQASAPTGWIQDVSDTANNRMMRVVSSTGGGVGGTLDPTVCNVVPAHTHSFTTGPESATHTHVDSGHTHLSSGGDSGTLPGFSVLDYDNTQQNITSVGYANIGVESVSHSHSGSTDNGSSATNFTPRYVNIIICTKQ